LSSSAHAKQSVLVSSSRAENLLIKNRAQRARFSNNPQRGMKMLLPPEGEKVESPLAYFCLLRQLIFIFQTSFLAFLGTLHTCESFLHQGQQYQHNNHVPKNDYPKKASSSAFETYLIHGLLCVL